MVRKVVGHVMVENRSVGPSRWGPLPARLRRNRTAAQWLMARAAQALPKSRFNAVAGSIL